MDMQSNTPPWKEKGMSYQSRLLARLGFIVAITLLICPGAPTLFLLFNSSRKIESLWDDVFPFIWTLGIVVGAIFAIIKLRPSWRAPINITPSYDPIAPSRLGEIFEVWHQEKIQGLPFGKGAIVFQASEMILEGYLFRGTLYSLLSSVQGGKVSAKVPYSNITSASVKGRYIIFKVKTEVMLMPQAEIAFYVSEMDGERMYKELKHHFPALLENK